MCGIFGLFFPAHADLKPGEVKQVLDYLFTVSQSRGQEASGLMLREGDACLINKSTLSGKGFIKQRSYKEYFDKATFGSRFVADAGFVSIGHARLDTHGSKWDNTNNAPINYKNLVGVHNGIIVNADSLWGASPQLERNLTVDSEILLALYHEQLKHHEPASALGNVLSMIEGSASTAIFDRDRNTVALGTNTGSLYVADYGGSAFVFASESYILECLNNKIGFLSRLRPYRMQQVLPGSVLVYDAARHDYGAYKGRIVNEVL